jgi:hypothetical protein
MRSWLWLGGGSAGRARGLVAIACPLWCVGATQLPADRWRLERLPQILNLARELAASSAGRSADSGQARQGEDREWPCARSESAAQDYERLCVDIRVVALRAEATARCARRGWHDTPAGRRKAPGVGSLSPARCPVSQALLERMSCVWLPNRTTYILLV